ncbi:trypsin-like peptidase domain-containing protein [Acidithrix ferrooxidans]|uniref:Tetratricopeptide repeat protein n=1 Tax=Acidithrix ferrooxidans TaxID=1280514 RepID=A0A0D8HMF8_9ACTN|nr:trypsin-like peptidase domain-containing protein [Acidithrix ferrooxidans]KJF19034.1 tetratricopeptide repeat protein [Acidithrix ferrooxidans]
MTSPWNDRLAQVWAGSHKPRAKVLADEPQSQAGTGVIIGDDGVLTARHVIAGALNGGTILARMVKQGATTSSWATMKVISHDLDWDLALLQVDDPKSDNQWQKPNSPSPQVVMLDGDAEHNCEVLGFPETAIQPSESGLPSEDIYQSEQALGTLLLTNQAKPAQTNKKTLPKRTFLLDVDRSHPKTSKGWQEMSGSGVVLSAGRLVGVVASVDQERDTHRLFVTPLADAISDSPGLAEGFTKLLGHPIPVEIEAAPLIEELLQGVCLGASGLPITLGEAELEAFGVKRANIIGEPAYLDYTKRDQDGELTKALDEAISSHRMLLIVGSSASGKSRSMAELAKAKLANYHLLCPKATLFSQLLELPLDSIKPAVVWLEDVENYVGLNFKGTISELLSEGLVVIGTIRQNQLEMHKPFGDAKMHKTLVLQKEWSNSWSKKERSELQNHVKNKALRQWVKKNNSPSVWCAAGTELADKLRIAKSNDDKPYRYQLVRTVLDWYRTGNARPIAIATATSLLTESIALSLAPDEQEVSDALTWATEPVVGKGRMSSQSLLSKVDDTYLKVHNYLQDEDAKSITAEVPDAIWRATLDAVGSDDERFTIGLFAYNQSNSKWAESAWRPLSDGGNSRAMLAMGMLCSEQGRHKDAIAIYDEAIPRFGDDPTPEIHEMVVRALFSKGAALGQYGQHEAAAEVYDEVIARFGDDPTPETHEVAVGALSSKGATLGELGRFRDAVPIFNAVVNRFGDDRTPEIRELVVKALLAKGIALEELIA